MEGRRGGGAEETSPRSPIPNPQSPIPTLTERRVFLTGGNGFLGGHVARALVEAGAQVVALVRPGSALGALAESAGHSGTR